MSVDDVNFHGAKLVLTEGDRLLTYLRDDLPHIPFPAHWDLPGGGREGHESPVECALRELYEEFGLTLSPARLIGLRFPSRIQKGPASWLFHGELTPAEIAAIRFGEEGQEWRMMTISAFLTHPFCVPHFKQRVKQLLSQHEPPPFPSSS